MVQICSFEKKKLSIQEKKNPLPPKPGRMVRCVSPYKIALFFFIKSKQQIETYRESVSDWKLIWIIEKQSLPFVYLNTHSFI